MKTFFSNLKRMFTVDHGTVHDYTPHRHVSLEGRVAAVERKLEVWVDSVTKNIHE